MVTLARSQRTGVLHYISNFICFGVLFLLFKCKKKNYFVTHALKYVSNVIILTAMTYFDLQRRWFSSL